jgi:predicted amino acid racemase
MSCPWIDVDLRKIRQNTQTVVQRLNARGIGVTTALAAAALLKETDHGIILMVEMGDQREGILPENLPAMAQQVMKMPGVALKGIGANCACLSGLAPNAAQMSALFEMANEVEALCGPFVQTVSGGDSANLPWALGAQSTGRVNDLRLGEAILLGVDPMPDDQINGLHTDAFTLVARVIEIDINPPTASMEIDRWPSSRKQGCSRHMIPGRKQS